MTGIEMAYRVLLRAYPPPHRAQYEDEMVAVLLDASEAGRRRPRAREAAAIVRAGLAVRLESRSELHHGFRLAGAGAVSVVCAMAAIALVLAVQQPIAGSWVAAALWVLAIGVALYGAWARSRFRVVPAATMTLLMMVTGASTGGFRRSVLVVAAAFLIIAALGPRSERSLRLLAPGLGLAAGTAIGVVNVMDLNNFFPLSAGPWAVNAQWQYSAEMVSSLLVRTSVVMLAAGLLLTMRRVRYLVATATLAVPVFVFGMFVPGGLLWQFADMPASNQATVAAVVAALVLGVAVLTPLRMERRAAQ